MSLGIQDPSPQPEALVTSALLSVPIVLSFWNVMLMGTSSVWLSASAFFHQSIHSRFVRVVGYISSFSSVAEWHSIGWMYRCLRVRSLTDGYLCCFSGLVIVKKAPRSITYRFSCAYIFSFPVVKCQGMGFLGCRTCMLQYSRSFPALSQSGSATLHSYQQ